MNESTIWADARLAGLSRIREGKDWKCQLMFIGLCPIFGF